MNPYDRMYEEYHSGRMPTSMLNPCDERVRRSRSITIELSGRPVHICLTDRQLYECYQMFKQDFPETFEKDATTYYRDKNKAKAEEHKVNTSVTRKLLKLFL